MASNVGIPRFTRINSSVLFRKGLNPNKASPLSQTPNPRLVLLLSWAGAPLRLVAKYTDAYEKLYPDSDILLIQTEFRQILRHTRTSQDVPLEPVLKLLREINPGTERRAETAKSGTLVHLFSNGGSYKLLEVAKRYKASVGSPLPMDALILDSAPGISTLIRSFKAISYALPTRRFLRWPLQVLLFLFLIIQRTIERIVLGEGLLRMGRRKMNDTSLIDRRARRVYIYGPGDELVGAQDVKDHAADAKDNGYETEEQVFLGTPHVAHMRGDPERYWEIVKRTWTASQTSSST